MFPSATAAAATTGGGLLTHVTLPAPAAVAGSGGSYTGVFVALGVIAALLVISCLVGQVCTKRHLRPRPRRDRVAYYDDEDDAECGHGRPGVAKMEAASAPPATTTVTAAAAQPASAETRTAPA